MSFESTTKYSEFTFDSPSNKAEKPKIKPKPANLSLDTFEQVINDLNDPKPTKVSLGKKLFEKQQRSSEDNERLVNTSNNDDTLNFDKEFSASMLSSTAKQQNFTKRNSIRRSSKASKKNSISYDDKPIVLFNSSPADGLINSGFDFDEESSSGSSATKKKTVPVTKIKLSSQDLVVQSSNLIRPPTPPPRSDKPLSFFNANESNNYNLNCCDEDKVVDKTRYKSNSNLSADKLQIKEADAHESLGLYLKLKKRKPFVIFTLCHSFSQLKKSMRSLKELTLSRLNWTLQNHNSKLKRLLLLPRVPS